MKRIFTLFSLCIVLMACGSGETTSSDEHQSSKENSADGKEQINQIAEAAKEAFLSGDIEPLRQYTEDNDVFEGDLTDEFEDLMRDAQFYFVDMENIQWDRVGSIDGQNQHGESFADIRSQFVSNGFDYELSVLKVKHTSDGYVLSGETRLKIDIDLSDELYCYCDSVLHADVSDSLIMASPAYDFCSNQARDSSYFARMTEDCP